MPGSDHVGSPQMQNDRQMIATGTCGGVRLLTYVSPKNGRNVVSTLQAVVSEGELFMPVLLIPALWVGGTAVVLGGGYFLLHGLHVIAW